MIKDKENSVLRKVSDDLWAAWRSRSLIAAIELNIFTALASSSHTADEVAKTINASPRGTKRLLDVLVAMEYLLKSGEQYTLAPEFRQLPLLVKGPLKGNLHLVRDTWNLWGKLPASVRSGGSLVKEENGVLSQQIYSELAESLFLIHYSTSRSLAAEITPMILSPNPRILDVAAGSGVWSIPLALANRRARVTVIDLPGVLPVCRKMTARLGVAAQYDYVAGDARNAQFEAESYDFVILGQILHDLGHTSSLSLLRNAFRALRQGGVLVVSESMPNDSRTAPLSSLLFGLNLLLCTPEGDVFTFSEYRDWLQEAGFTEIRRLPKDLSSLIIAVKIAPSPHSRTGREVRHSVCVGDSSPVLP